MHLNAAVLVSGRATYGDVPTSVIVQEAINQTDMESTTILQFTRGLERTIDQLLADHFNGSDLNLVVAGYSPNSNIPEFYELRIEISDVHLMDYTISLVENPLECDVYLLRGDLYNEEEFHPDDTEEGDKEFGVTRLLLHNECTQQVYDAMSDLEHLVPRNLTCQEAIRITKDVIGAAYKEAKIKRIGASTVGGEAVLAFLSPGLPPELCRWTPII